jgi:hypothetical protein
MPYKILIRLLLFFRYRRYTSICTIKKGMDGCGRQRFARASYVVWLQMISVR